ncbi:MAG TPA: hypothetical protein VEU62_05560 [Bryobacterales bacterium]|nr:hypothetical protein [Bryobacterales bacterium]
MSLLRTGIRIAASAAAVAVLGVAFFATLRLGFADRVFHTGTLEGAERAARLVPGNASYLAGWAVLLDQSGGSSAASLRALERAVAANPRNSSCWIELGLRAEREGDLAAAERSLLEAARVDKQYDPRWELANFYFRRNDAENFWLWAGEAAAVLSGDATPLFRLCWKVSPDAAMILKRAVPNRPPILAKYLGFLLADHHGEVVEPVALKVLERAGPDELPALLASCDRLLEAGRVSEALRIWNALCRRKLVPYPEVEPEKGLSLTNGGWRAPPLSHGFDWRIDPPEGVSWPRDEPPPPLRITFSGRQPESCEILSQLVPLVPGKRYRLRLRYTVSNIAPQAGLRWRIFDAATNAELAAGSPRSTENQVQEDLRFAAPGGAGLARVALTYQRALGTTRIEGSVLLGDATLTFAAPQQEQ